MTKFKCKRPFLAALLAGTFFSAPSLADDGFTRIAAVPLKAEFTGIANPDNILVLNDRRVLIGEDTGNQENGAMWLYAPPGRPAR